MRWSLMLLIAGAAFFIFSVVQFASFYGAQAAPALLTNLGIIDQVPSPTPTPTPIPPPTPTPTPTPSPIDAIEQLIQHVLDLNLNHNIEKSLVTKLDAALNALTDANPNNDHVAINKLQDFINQVNALRGKLISDDDADALTAAADSIIAALMSS